MVSKRLSASDERNVFFCVHSWPVTGFIPVQFRGPSPKLKPLFDTLRAGDQDIERTVIRLIGLKLDGRWGVSAGRWGITSCNNNNMVTMSNAERDDDNDPGFLNVIQSSSQRTNPLPQ